MLLFTQFSFKKNVLLCIQILAFSDSLEYHDFNINKNEFDTVIMASLINIWA